MIPPSRPSSRVRTLPFPQRIRAVSNKPRRLWCSSKQVAPETSQKKYEALQKKILNDPSNTIYDPDFPGAWYLPGTTAAMKVGGYVDLSVVNSFDPMLQPDRFVVGSIPPKGEPVAGAEKGTNVTASRSRVNLEYREQTKQGEIRAFVEGDFQGDGDTFRVTPCIWPIPFSAGRKDLVHADEYER